MKESLLNPEQRNSKHLKMELMHHLFWGLNYSIVVDEFEFMDVFGVKRNGYTAEFEIKVSKSDFDKELEIITETPQPRYPFGKIWPKWYKHASYLGKKVDTTNFSDSIKMLGIGEYRNMPNDFYFYLPDYLCDYALPKLAGLPYGLVKIGKTCRNGHPDTGSFYWCYDVLKKSTKLHTKKADSDLYYSLAHALTIRNKLLN